MTKPTDNELEARLRLAVDTFHDAVDAAVDAGLSVRFGIATWPGLPKKSYIAGLRVERDKPL